MAKWKVAVTDDRYGDYTEEEQVLKDLDCRLEVHNFGTAREAIEGLRGVHGILLNLFPLDREIIQTLDTCQIISRYGVGYDNVDVGAATEKKIWVARVPDYASEDTSDQAMALFLACVRNVPFKDRGVREGRWNLYKERSSRRITGKVFGIVGYGGVGMALHRKLKGFSLAKVLICDPTEDPELIRKNGGEKTDLLTLLRESDYVSLHLPLKEETKNLISSSQLEAMKPGAILINTARGGLIDEDALIKVLRDGKISAGLDVFSREPIGRDNPLLQLDNVVLSDHTGWYSEESIKELKTKAAQNIAAVLSGGPPVYPVNTLDKV